MRLNAFRRLLIATLSVWLTSSAGAEPVRVRFAEGLVHGFLKLSALDNTVLADGDLIQTAQGTLVTSRLVFHFRDGSLHDETAVFDQRGEFRLVSYRLVQHGASFPRTLEMSIESSAETTVKFTDEHKQQKVERERFAAPDDLANGLVPTLLKDVRPTAPPAQLSMIVATPKPRMVTLKLQAPTEDHFSTGGLRRSATHYVFKVDVGGLAKFVAPIVGKQPADVHVWILAGEAPVFVKSEQQLYVDGPIWRIELVSPAWPR